MEEYVKIGIAEKDKVSGFYILLTKAKNPFSCLPDNIYLVKKRDLDDLVKEEIGFKIL